MINHKLFQLKKSKDNRGIFYESFSIDFELGEKKKVKKGKIK